MGIVRRQSSEAINTGPSRSHRNMAEWISSGRPANDYNRRQSRGVYAANRVPSGICIEIIYRCQFRPASGVLYFHRNSFALSVANEFVPNLGLLDDGDLL
jgi:hypothetical protein